MADVDKGSLSKLKKALSPSNLNQKEVGTISIEGTAEEIAESLIQGYSPEVYFDEVDVSSDEGKALFLSLVISRPGMVSLEKDEIIGFVELNRDHFLEFKHSFLKDLKEVVGKIDETRRQFLEYFEEAINAAYIKKFDQINVKSDKFLWFLYALNLKIQDGYKYSEAVNEIREPKNRERINTLTVDYMLKDYVEAVGSPNQPTLTYLMLIGESASVINHPNAALAVYSIVSKQSWETEIYPLSSYLENMITYFLKNDLLDDDINESINQISERLSDGDFGPQDC